MSCILPDGAVAFANGLTWTYDDALGRWVSPSLGTPQIYSGDISVTTGGYTELAQADYSPFFIQDYKAIVALGYIPQGKVVARLGGGSTTTYMTCELWDQDVGDAASCNSSASLGQLSTEISHLEFFCVTNFAFSAWADFTSLATATEDHATLRIVAKVASGTGHLYGPVARVRYTSVTQPVQ